MEAGVMTFVAHCTVLWYSTYVRSNYRIDYGCACNQLTRLVHNTVVMYTCVEVNVQMRVINSPTVVIQYTRALKSPFRGVRSIHQTYTHYCGDIHVR